jgi:four helix bundle protein
MAKKVIRSFRDLDVYQKLFQLHLDVHELTLRFPKYELYELGSQLRRSSNSAPANLAEGWNNKHTNIYLEGISRAISEVQETRHHLDVGKRKGYVDDARHEKLTMRYDECEKMLWGLAAAVGRSRLPLSPITSHLSPG